MKLATFAPLLLLLLVHHIDGRVFHARQTDSLTVMREQCSRTPFVDECTRVKQQMEELLRKCRDMATPVSACGDVRHKYCYIWSKELFCYASPGGVGGSGGNQVSTTRPPSSSSDPLWYQIPSDPNELKLRGDYCVSHQSEPKCRNLLSALKVRYDECSKRPKTDTSCQSFKRALCSAFPSFSPCLNGGSAMKRRSTRLERSLRHRQQVLLA